MGMGTLRISSNLTVDALKIRRNCSQLRLVVCNISFFPVAGQIITIWANYSDVSRGDEVGILELAR